ncbi:MAG: hypothetical protein U0361_07435 [Nitrospiraceae bacterium]
MGDLEGGHRRIPTASDLQLTDVNTHFNLGLAFLEKKNVEGAINEFRVTTHSQLNDGKIRYNLGQALASIGRRTEAAQESRGSTCDSELDTPATQPPLDRAGRGENSRTRDARIQSVSLRSLLLQLLVCLPGSAHPEDQYR